MRLCFVETTALFALLFPNLLYAQTTQAEAAIYGRSNHTFFMDDTSGNESAMVTDSHSGNAFNRLQSVDTLAQIIEGDSFGAYNRLVTNTYSDNAGGAQPQGNVVTRWQDEVGIINGYTAPIQVIYEVAGNLPIEVNGTAADMSASFAFRPGIGGLPINSDAGTGTRAQNTSQGDISDFNVWIEHEVYEQDGFSGDETFEEWHSSDTWEILNISGDSFAGRISQTVHYNTALGHHQIGSTFLATSLSEHGSALADISVSLVEIRNESGQVINEQLTFGSNRNVFEVDGDFDEDGTVDGADFLSWQRRDGTPLDLSLDLTRWLVTYGDEPNPLPLISGEFAAVRQVVPEPPTAVLVIMTFLYWMQRRT